MNPTHAALLRKYNACSTYAFRPNLAAVWLSNATPVRDLLWGAARLLPHAGCRFACLADIWAADAARYAASTLVARDAAHDAVARYTAAFYAAHDADAAFYAARYAASTIGACADGATRYAARRQREDLRAMFPEMADAITFYAASAP